MELTRQRSIVDVVVQITGRSGEEPGEIKLLTCPWLGDRASLSASSLAIDFFDGNI
jgi:hypothetical protein